MPTKPNTPDRLSPADGFITGAGTVTVSARYTHPSDLSGRLCFYLTLDKAKTLGCSGNLNHGNSASVRLPLKNIGDPSIWWENRSVYWKVYA